VEVDKINDNQHQYEKLNKEFEQLEKQRAMAKKAIDSTNKKYQTLLQEKKKEHETLKS